MKDSIYFVPVAEDFIDLEHLLHIGKPSFNLMHESISIELKYMFHKESVVIGVRAMDLFSPEEAEQYGGYKLNKPACSSIGNLLGEKFMNDSLKKFKEKVGFSIYSAWKSYRESKKNK